jgi:hypothetical protein
VSTTDRILFVTVDQTPGLAGDYISQLEGSAPTKHQALAALQYFFDAMVTRHVVLLNSFASVLAPRWGLY